MGGLLGSPFLLSAQTYFQQQVDHRISVRLDDVQHMLHAEEEFDYHNRSTRALDTLWIHLWPNAYRDTETALCKQLDAQNDFSLHFASERSRGWIDSLDFSSDGARLKWGYHPQHSDIAWVALPRPLLPGTSTTLRTPFRVKLPSANFSRLGHIQQAYYISQWYPKPAVFDTQGWHAMPYLTQGEFYGEFGSFEVSITLPANYVVGATGALQDPTEIAFMETLAAAAPTFTLGGGSDPFPPSATEMKTIRFRQDRVHDFAWFADKRFLVKKSAITLARSGRTVDTWALFTPSNALLWQSAPSYLNESLRLYSEWLGDYPYSSCTAVDGTVAAGGGMEYPMITLINTPESAFDLETVIAHEVGHNWFQGILGSNERDHAWMDEGINSFYEQRYVENRYPGKRVMDLQGIPIGFLTRHRGITYRQQNELQYRFNARRNRDAALGTPATDFAYLDYGTTVYSKGALMMAELQHRIGDAPFDARMQQYFDTWKFKHPSPDDLRTTLVADNDSIGKVFDAFTLTAEKLDVRHRPRPTGEGPVHTPLDIDPRNDVQGLRFPAVQFLAGLEREDRRSIYWTPVIGRNTHDGWMPGLALYNTVFPNQRFEWAAAPLYGMKSERPAGGARFMWNHDRLNSAWLRNLHIGISGFSASLPSTEPHARWYQRVVPSIQLDPRGPAVGTEMNVRYRSILLRHHLEGGGTTDAASPAIDLVREDVYHELRLQAQRSMGLHPFDVGITALQHDLFTRASLDAKWSAIYDRHRHRITFRAFTGAFLRKDALSDPAMGWRLHWGSSDLLHDHLYLDRQAVGVNTAQQFNKDQGGFKTPTSTGTSDTWIAALNMEVDFPFALPLSFFASYGNAPYTTISNAGRTTGVKGYWEMGLGVRIWRDLVEMWVPLAFSEDIRKEQELRNFQFSDRIRFVFALEKMDPTQALRKLPH
ncbi:MAG TPA: M1 family metallopeptidase [Flavobacteriales bacterium]